MANDITTIPFLNILNGSVESMGVTSYITPAVLSSNPNYAVNISKKVNASSTYQRSKILDWTQAEYRTTSQRISDKDIREARSTLAATAVSSGGSSSEDAIALERFKNAIRSQIDDFKAMAPLAEARDLHTTIVSMHRLAGQFLTRAITLKKRALRGHLSPREARAIVRDLQDSWLTYAFGVSPMVRDAQRLGQSIASFLGRGNKTVRIKRGHSYSYRGGNINSSTPSVANGFTLSSLKKTILTYRTVNYTGGFLYEVGAGNDYTIFDHLGFTPDQIPSTAWELLGLSWIVDYYVNVGTFIDDVFDCNPVRTVYLVKSVKERTICDYVWQFTEPTPASGFRSIGWSAQPGRFEAVTFRRDPLQVLPSIPLRFRTFSEIGDLGYSTGRLLNLVSLLKPQR